MLKKATNIILTSLVFLVPLFFLTTTSRFYEFNKNALLFLGVALLLLINPVLRSIQKKELRLILTPLDLPVLLFALSVLFSLALQSPNKQEALILPGGVGTILALTLLYFSITQTRLGQKLLTPLIVSASFLAISSIFFFLEWWRAWGVNLPVWLAQKFFSPAGGLLPQAMFLGVALVLVGVKLKNHFQGQERLPTRDYLYYLFACFILAIGLGLSVHQLLTTQKPSFLPYSFGWSIAVETFKNLRTALLGVGSLNFLSAFTRFKPLGFNASSVWNLRFTASSNWYLTLLTETGFLSLAAYLFLVYKVFKTKSSLLYNRHFSQLGEKKKVPSEVSGSYPLVAIFLLQLLLPPNFLLLFTFYVLLALYASTLPEKKKIVEESQILPWLVSIITTAVLAFGLFSLGRAYLAEMAFRQSLDALAQNRGIDTYNQQIKALTLAPFITTYRLAYSQTNFALANSLAGQADPSAGPPAGRAGEAGLTDQDRANISQLVQQAIREAKLAVSLNPTSIVSWENLAALYQNLINFAQGADQWTLATYAQAIGLDPLNPQLRIALGGVYYGLGNYDEAERQFRIGVDLKPDLANAHYNLAAALREKEEYQKAAQEMQVTLSLVEPETNDFEKVSQELEDLKSKVALETPEVPPGELETLSPPSTPPAGIKPPLELPEEAEPEISPRPSPTETPEEEEALEEISPTVTLTP